MLTKEKGRNVFLHLTHKSEEAWVCYSYLPRMSSKKKERENERDGKKMYNGPRGMALFLSDVTASYCICILYRIVKSLSPQSVSGFGGSHIQWLDCVDPQSHPLLERRASIHTLSELTQNYYPLSKKP